MSDEPHVKVTLTEIYDVVKETRDEVKQLSQALGEITKDTVDHESRIRSLERKVWAATGLAALAGAGFLEGLQQILK